LWLNEFVAGVMTYVNAEKYYVLLGFDRAWLYLWDFSKLRSATLELNDL